MVRWDARRVATRGKALSVNRREGCVATLYIPLRNSSLERSAAATKTTSVGASAAAQRRLFPLARTKTETLRLFVRAPSPALPPSFGRPRRRIEGSECTHSTGLCYCPCTPSLLMRKAEKVPFDLIIRKRSLHGTKRITFLNVEGDAL